MHFLEILIVLADVSFIQTGKQKSFAKVL